MQRLFTTLLFTLLLVGGLQALPIERSRMIVYIQGSKYYIHTVESGESLTQIAQAYATSEQEILKLNPQAKDGLKADQTLKIPFVAPQVSANQSEERADDRRSKRDFTTHRVAQGETLYAISRRYEISVQTILEDNPQVDPLQLKVGTELQIRKRAIGRTNAESTQRALEEYAEALNQVEGEQKDSPYLYYVVKPRETIYSLSRRFGMSEQELITLNNLQDGLKAGQIIRVPNPEVLKAEVGAPAEAVGSQTGEGELFEEKESAPKPELFFKALRPYERLQVALLLPLSDKQGVANSNYTAFYQGFLLGLEELKAAGRSVDLTLFDTRRDTTCLREIMAQESFRRAQLIVGPVYSEELALLIPYAEEHSLPLVSPLASYQNLDSDALFQMAPAAGHKYDKLSSLLTPDLSITLIRTPEIDREFEQEITAALKGHPYTYFDYETVQGVENAEKGDLTPLLTSQEKHLFVVLSRSEVEVDRILASLSSAQNNLQARSLNAPTYQVLGSTRWNRFTNIDRTTLFKNRTILFSLFHAKRDSEQVRLFDRRYLGAFSMLPNLYSYRGYEAAKIFGEGLYGDIEYKMEGRRYRPLQTPYTFQQEEGRVSHENQEWVRIQYNLDFTITIE